MSITPVETNYVSASVIYNRISPFLVDQPVRIFSTAGTTLYGANHPGTGSTTKYARFVQSVTGNKGFTLPTANTAPQQTSGAVTAANQLRTVVLKNGVPLMHTDDSAVAAASSYCIGVGGGTAIADATLSVKGTTAADLLAGSILLSAASSGALTTTVLVGDIITLASHSTVYRCTETSQAFNGTTEVEISITPPLTQAVVAGDVITIATSDDRTILFATAPTVGDIIEVFVLAAGDVITLGNAAGAITAGRVYIDKCTSFMHCAGNASVSRAIG